MLDLSKIGILLTHNIRLQHTKDDVTLTASNKSVEIKGKYSVQLILNCRSSTFGNSIMN
jgi:hypothetical protein